MGERGRWNREISFFTSELDPIFEPHDFLASGHKRGGGGEMLFFFPRFCARVLSAGVSGDRAAFRKRGGGGGSCHM